MNNIRWQVDESTGAGEQIDKGNTKTYIYTYTRDTRERLDEMRGRLTKGTGSARIEEFMSGV